MDRTTQQNASPPPAPPDEATLLRLLADAARDFAIFATDTDGDILTWNPGVRNITGYDEQEFIGQNCRILFTPEDQEAGGPEQERGTALQDGQAVDERWHVKKNGSRFWGSGFMHALFDENGNHRGFAKILRDMTEQKRQGEELEERVRERTAAHTDVQRRLLTLQEDERRRISREMHDQTGQHLAALGLELGLLEQRVTVVQDAAATAARAAVAAAQAARTAAERAEAAVTHAMKADALPGAARLAHVASEEARMAAITAYDMGAAAAAANEAAAANATMTAVSEGKPRVTHLRTLVELLSRDIHRLAVDLRPTSLDDLGLMPALRTLSETCAAARAGLSVQVESVGLEDDDLEDGHSEGRPGHLVGELHSPAQITGRQQRRLPFDIETALYRIVQEALTNAAKYAAPVGATRVSVLLQRRGGFVLATIEDDGPGFDPRSAGEGRLGLAGMRERATLLGGALEVESSPGNGATVYARIPLPQTSPPR